MIDSELYFLLLDHNQGRTIELDDDASWSVTGGAEPAPRSARPEHPGGRPAGRSGYLEGGR